METIYFLTVTKVIKINKDQILAFGGVHGIRDYGLLESAIYDVQATFGGKYLYKDMYHMAAAYAYSIIKNHPFIDGNKRTGIVASLFFLRRNGYKISLTQAEFYKLGIAIATSKTTIQEIAAFFKQKLKQ